ncbi:MAG: DNA cytosine methyltransferase [Alphaproteobacteria bacterium]|nr:DNA cytosine methyltransferase [Alphaproteobacteria bacterium]
MEYKRLKPFVSRTYTRGHIPTSHHDEMPNSISNGRNGHCDEEQIRGISLRKAAILQLFPDDYIFYFTPRSKLSPLLG